MGVCVGGLAGKGDGTKLAECLHAIADFSGQVAKACTFLPTLLACLAAAFEDVFDLKAECCGGGDICVVAHVCVWLKCYLYFIRLGLSRDILGTGD